MLLWYQSIVVAMNCSFDTVANVMETPNSKTYRNPQIWLKITFGSSSTQSILIGLMVIYQKRPSSNLSLYYWAHLIIEHDISKWHRLFWMNHYESCIWVSIKWRRGGFLLPIHLLSNKLWRFCWEVTIIYTWEICDILMAPLNKKPNIWFNKLNLSLETMVFVTSTCKFIIA